MLDKYTSGKIEGIEYALEIFRRKDYNKAKEVLNKVLEELKIIDFEKSEYMEEKENE